MGDIGNDVNDDTLTRAFSKYPTFLKAKVIRERQTKKTKGYGFVSFKDPHDFMQAMREMNGNYTRSYINSSLVPSPHSTVIIACSTNSCATCTELWSRVHKNRRLE